MDYTCNGCKDAVNCKSHLTKPQEALNVENVKTIFNFEKFIKHQRVLCMMEKSVEHEIVVDERKRFFQEGIS